METKVPPGTPDAVMAQTGTGKKKKKDTEDETNNGIILYCCTLFLPHDKSAVYTQFVSIFPMRTLHKVNE
jgi:hypothetical protein